MLNTKLYGKATVRGPYFHSGHQRWYVQVVITEDDIKTLLLSRYKMQEYLGVILPSDSHVDHIDGNQLNDALDNLQVMTVAEHNAKTHTKYDPTVDVICVFCKTMFTLSKKQQYARAETRKKGKSGPFCSTACSNRNRYCR